MMVVPMLVIMPTTIIMPATIIMPVIIIAITPPMVHAGVLAFPIAIMMAIIMETMRLFIIAVVEYRRGGNIDWCGLHIFRFGADAEREAVRESGTG